jgi:NAD(P)H dehydrogenase (quinone)
MSEQSIGVHVLIPYYSRFGVIASLAERVAEGVAQVSGATAELLPIEDQPVDEARAGEQPDDMLLRRARIVDRFAEADALVVGSPAYFGSMASAVKRLFEDCATASAPGGVDRTRPWHVQLLHDKVGAAFTASATPHGGNEMALHSILTMMMHLGMVLVTPGQHEPILENDAAPYGATAVTGALGTRPPAELEERAARDLGRRVAEYALWLRIGRIEAGRRAPPATLAPLESAFWQEQHQPAPSSAISRENVTVDRTRRQR